MADSITTFVLSRQATMIANRVKEEGMFPDALSASKFGMSYAIKYYWEEIDTEEELNHLDKVYDSTGTTYNVGSVDSDGFIKNLISSLYPYCESPYKYARVLMCFGLYKLGDLMDEGKLFPINKLM